MRARMKRMREWVMQRLRAIRRSGRQVENTPQGTLQRPRFLVETPSIDERQGESSCAVIVTRYCSKRRVVDLER